MDPLWNCRPMLNQYRLNRKFNSLQLVSERLSTALKKVRKMDKIGGKSLGSLTDDRIMKITNYYGKAIADNAHDIQKMQGAIYTFLLHFNSTDQEL